MGVLPCLRRVVTKPLLDSSSVSLGVGLAPFTEAGKVTATVGLFPPTRSCTMAFWVSDPAVASFDLAFLTVARVGLSLKVLYLLRIASTPTAVRLSLPGSLLRCLKR